MTSFAKYRIASLLIAVLLIGLRVSTAQAGFAVSPLKQEVSVKPGESETFTITLSNHNRTGPEVAQSMHLAIFDVQVADDGSLIFKDPGTGEHSASKWVSLSNSQVTIDPGTNKTVEFTVKIPLSTPPGEYYSSIIVALDNKIRDAKGMLVEYRIASGVFVTVPGRTFPRQAKITRCELLWPQIAAPGEEQPADTQPPKVYLTLKNTGQARFDATGKVALFDEKSRLVFAGPLNTKRPCVFGGDSRFFETPINKPIPAGKYTAKITLDYQSTWASLHQTLPVDILPEQANLLTLLKSRQLNDSTGLEAAPEKVALTIPAGGSRNIALAVKNVIDVAVQCNTSVFPSDDPAVDAWIAVSTPDCTITKGARKSIALSIAIPKGTKGGKYSSTIALEGTPEGTDPAMLLVPVEIDVKAER